MEGGESHCLRCQAPLCEGLQRGLELQALWLSARWVASSSHDVTLPRPSPTQAEPLAR